MVLVVRVVAGFFLESARRSAPAFISFACPKETNQRKRPPKTCPLPSQGVPCASRPRPALRSTLTPWCSRAPQVENGSARGLSDRAKRGSSAAPFFCRGAQGSRRVAQTKPWGALSFAFFSLGTQRKEGRVCAAAHIEKDPRNNANTPSRVNPNCLPRRTLHPCTRKKSKPDEKKPWGPGSLWPRTQHAFPN